MTPRIVEEFLSFFENKEQPFLKDFFKWNHHPVSQCRITFLFGSNFYQLVDDIRARSYRGLRVGEEEIQKAGHLMQGKTDLSKKDFEISIGEVVKNSETGIGKLPGLGFWTASQTLISSCFPKNWGNSGVYR